MCLLQKLQLHKIVLIYQYYTHIDLYIGRTYNLQKSVKMLLIKMSRLNLLLVKCYIFLKT